MRLPWREVPPGPGPGIDTSLTSAETEELRRLAHDADVLEIGSAYGYSAIAMALAGGRVLAVDLHQQLNSYGTMVANVALFNVADRVEIRRGDCRAVLPELYEAGRRFDLVWIDGDHAADMVTHDVTWGCRLLKTTGTLACHDYDEDTCPGVRQALDVWITPPKLVDTLAVYGPGQRGEQ